MAPPALIAAIFENSPGDILGECFSVFTVLKEAYGANGTSSDIFLGTPFVFDVLSGFVCFF